MKKILSIKWELIQAIALGITTLLSWSLWETEKQDWRLLLLVLIPTIAFIIWIVAYPSIKQFRKTVRNMW